MRLFSTIGSPSAAFLASAVALFAAACAAPESSGGDAEAARVGEEQSEIFKGTLDTTHDAVVQMFTKGGYACTATIIAKSGSTGYALTAAHCVEDTPDVIVEGDDSQNAVTAVYKITAFKADPGYLSSGKQNHDFAMLKFTGAGAGTKVIPVLTPAEDTMKVGSKLVQVGFGRTETNANNTKRLKVTNTISQTSALLVRYEQETEGGPCQGDSGGPGLFTTPSGERLAVITSFGDEFCTDYGVSGRASAVLNSFITPFITGSTGGAQTCDVCIEGATTGQGACIGSVNACFNDAQCSALVQCFEGCSTQTCYTACGDKYPTGLDKYLAIFDCVCDTGCKTECASDPTCQNNTSCGFSVDDPQHPQCGGCFEGSCCSQGAACANDAACFDCLTNPNPPASCGTNALANSFYGCIEANCASQCGLGGTSGATSTGSLDPATAAGVGGGATASTATSSSAAGVGGSNEGGAANAGGADEPKSGEASSSTSGCACEVLGRSASGSPLSTYALAMAGIAAVAARRRKRG